MLVMLLQSTQAKTPPYAFPVPRPGCMTLLEKGSEERTPCISRQIHPRSGPPCARRFPLRCCRCAGAGHDTVHPGRARRLRRHRERHLHRQPGPTASPSDHPARFLTSTRSPPTSRRTPRSPASSSSASAGPSPSTARPGRSTSSLPRGGFRHLRAQFRRRPQHHQPIGRHHL
jgi:hypothetical protein